MAAHHSQPQGYYAASVAPRLLHKSLRGTIACDVCVVGGGFTGISAALHLAENGVRIVLLEAESIGFAASGRNGGQIHSGQRHPQAMLESWLGAGHARDLWQLAEQAKALIHRLAGRHGIECALKPGLVIAAHNRAALRALEEEAGHLSGAYGYTALRMMDRHETASALGTTLYPGSRYDGGGGHLHPLAFVIGLAGAAERSGARIFEQTPAVHLETHGSRHTIRSPHGAVTAHHVVLACDAFTGRIAPQIAPYIAPVESFIVATAPLGEEQAQATLPLDCAVADTRHVLDYYRKSEDSRLLFAGREAYFGIPHDIAGLVRPRMVRVFPHLRDVPIDYAWHGTVGLTRTRLPHFGRLNDGVLFAHGYSGHGVALSVLGGQVMADAILGDAARFNIFARIPQQRFPGGATLRKPLVSAALAWYKLRDVF